MITEEQIKLVQATWTKLIPKSFQLSGIFYSTMFQRHPELRVMFKTDIKEQGKKLMQTIGTSVLSLANISKVEESIKEMGRRHVEYGVKPEHYPMVKNVLVHALGEILADEFTPDVQEAWGLTWDIMSDLMLEEAEKKESALIRFLRKSKFW